MKRAVCVLLLGFSGSASAADGFTSQELLQALNGAGMGPNEGVCYPDGVTNGQVSAITKKYLEDHPESWNLNARYGVWGALLSTWPCKSTT
jgi:hypothetical protein